MHNVSNSILILTLFGDKILQSASFLARAAFIERIVWLLPRRFSVCPSVYKPDMHCDHTVHFSADFSSRLDSPTFWVPWH